MNKRVFLLFFTVVSLASCAKTERLYGENQYNSPDFDENYYTEWDGVKDLTVTGNVTHTLNNPYSSMSNEIKIGGDVIPNYTWDGDHEKQFGYNNNLSKIEKKFNYGVTSKLFDGRVRCEQLYQKSRVQVDKSGFAMFFPKALKSVKYLGFACRGGTDYSRGEEFSYKDLKINVEWSFYIHISSSEYRKITFDLQGVTLPVDNGGATTFVNFLPSLGELELYDATAMSFKWEYADTKIQDEIDKGIKTHEDLVDDYTQKEKHHLALMLYEVFIGDSIWG